MDSFAMNLTLMQATIVEQQITNFVLENEYEKQLGLVTENSKLKDAGKWIKERIDHFIEIIKSWWSKIVHFLTKTLPEWAAKKKKWLLELLHIRQKAVKVDDSKINEGDREKVKETCKKASRINIFKFAKNKKKGEDGDSLSSDLKDITNSLEKAVENGEEIHKRVENDFKKWDEDQKKNEEFDKQAEKNLQEAKDFLKNLENKSDNPAEKAELKKAADAIEQGKPVETTSEKDQNLEGNLIDIDLCKTYLSFISDSFRTLHDTTHGVLFPDDIREDIDNGDANDDRYKKYINRQINKYADRIDNYKRYNELKNEYKMDFSNLEKSIEKRKMLKSEVEQEINQCDMRKYFENSVKILQKTTTNMVREYEDLKSVEFIDQKALAKAISASKAYMEDSTQLAKDLSKTQNLLMTGLTNFLTTAKPCSNN